MSESVKYRGRIAPSPTGLLHLGHAATFWAAYRRAADARGELVLRMEDLDPQRSKTAFAEAAIGDLRWLGIHWNQGPDIGGPHAPYLQSERQPYYRDALQRLVEGGFVYPCRCSRSDLARAAQAPHDDEPTYPGTCRPAGTVSSISNPNPEINWRFRVAEGEAISFIDGNLGAQRFTAGRDFCDFLVWRKDGVAAYQLAVVVDDAAMRIREVVRGADLLKSTARQILLYRALGLSEPAWFHCSLVCDAKGERLAKRHDALSLKELRASGMKPAEVLALAAASFEKPMAHRGPDL